MRQDFDLELIAGRNDLSPRRYRGLGDAQHRSEPHLGSEASQNFVVCHGVNYIHAAIDMSMPNFNNLLSMGGKRQVSRPEEVGQRIKAARKAADLTQVELAAMADITQPTLSALERGTTQKPEAETILKLAIALRCTPFYLLWNHDLPDTTGTTHAAWIELWQSLDESQRE
jgi:DNA-binding XRE family transcriptional regulator